MNRPLKNALGNERGAILIQVAVALVGLLAFGAMVIDYGVLWAARRQAQNAADAAALAGAGWLSTNGTDYDGARKAARGIAAAHYVFGANPNVNLGSGFSTDVTGDISFPLCPAGAPGAGTVTCVRVNIYRNESAHDGIAAAPLPTFLARLFGRTQQGVQATAYTEAAAGNAIDCLRPFAVPDLWIDTDNSGFDNWDPGDIYRPPSDPNPTGYTLANNLGTDVLLHGDPSDVTNRSPGWFSLLSLAGPGGADVRLAIKGCTGGPAFTIGDLLPPAQGEKQGPTKQGVDAVVALDPNAQWDPVTKTIINSCVDTHTCQTYVWDNASQQQIGPVPDPGATVSPRITPVPLFDPQLFATTGDLKIVNFFGFFLEPMQGKDLHGIIVNEPELTVGSGGSVDPSAAFITTLILVR